MHNHSICIWTCILVTFVILGAGFAISTLNNNNGIHTHPSGKAVYLAGESCIINATPDISLVELQKLYVETCSVNHMEYLSK